MVVVVVTVPLLEKTNQGQVEQVVTLDLELALEQVAQTMLTVPMALLVVAVVEVTLKAPLRALHQLMVRVDLILVSARTVVVVVMVN
jgi:hypothetical protein